MALSWNLTTEEYHRSVESRANLSAHRLKSPIGEKERDYNLYINPTFGQSFDNVKSTEKVHIKEANNYKSENHNIEELNNFKESSGSLRMDKQNPKNTENKKFNNIIDIGEIDLNKLNTLNNSNKSIENITKQSIPNLKVNNMLKSQSDSDNSVITKSNNYKHYIENSESETSNYTAPEFREYKNNCPKLGDFTETSDAYRKTNTQPINQEQWNEQNMIKMPDFWVPTKNSNDDLPRFNN